MSDTVGAQLRAWRQRRGLSQLDLSLQAAVSTRHLSCIETGRSRPSRSMLLHLAERLDMPLRARNLVLLAAGYAPVYPQRALTEPRLDAVRGALDRILAAHEPYPALVVDGQLTLVTANASAAWLAGAVASHLLQPPINVLRLCLHPDGLAPAIGNLPELRGHVLADLGRQVARSASLELAALHEELSGYPGGEQATDSSDGVAIPIRLRVDDHELALISTIATFSRAIDVTVAELAIESFFPADAATAAILRARDATG